MFPPLPGSISSLLVIDAADDLAGVDKDHPDFRQFNKVVFDNEDTVLDVVGGDI